MNQMLFLATPTNLPLLHIQLFDALGSVFSGVSTIDDNIVVHLTADSPEIEDQVRAVVAAHNPHDLTPEQQAEADRVASLHQLEAANKTRLDLQNYAQSAPEIRRLAEKIAWLELEIAARQ